MLENTLKPLVSIIIPSYNQGAFIRETIESCLAQDYRPIEVIVVDGASTDNTVTILHDYDNVPEVNWMSEPDSGVAEAVNKGLDLAKGEIAGIQNSDDTYLQGAVSQAVKHLTESSELGIVYSDCVYIDAEGNELKRPQTEPFSISNFLCKNTIILLSAAFFRRDLAREVGGWDSNYFIADTEMWLRMIFCTKAKKIDSFWGTRRIHDEQRNKQAFKIVESNKRMVDTSPEITSASKCLRQAAKCGKYLTTATYNPSGNNIIRWFLYLRAVLAFPSVYKTQNLGRVLIPNYWFFYKWGRKIFRNVNKLKNQIHGNNTR